MATRNRANPPTTGCRRSAAIAESRTGLTLWFDNHTLIPAAS